MAGEIITEGLIPHLAHHFLFSTRFDPICTSIYDVPCNFSSAGLCSSPEANGKEWNLWFSMHEMLNFVLFYFLSHNFIFHSVHRFGLLVFTCSVTFGFAFCVIFLNWIELVFLVTADKILVIAKLISIYNLKNFIVGYVHKHINTGHHSCC